MAFRPRPKYGNRSCSEVLVFYRKRERTFLSISATPEVRVIVALDTVPSSLCWKQTNGVSAMAP
jgi:hypothetical protein